MIHFAGRKYVNESVENPLRYYDHNVKVGGLCRSRLAWPQLVVVAGRLLNQLAPLEPVAAGNGDSSAGWVCRSGAHTSCAATRLLCRSAAARPQPTTPPPNSRRLQGTINLCLTMNKYGCKNMVFSSSCTVYGNPQVGGQARSRLGAEGGCSVLCGTPRCGRCLKASCFGAPAAAAPLLPRHPCCGSSGWLIPVVPCCLPPLCAFTVRAN